MLSFFKSNTVSAAEEEVKRLRRALPGPNHVDKEHADISPPTPLAQLLSRTLPDTEITCPQVIVLGQKSAGKTKMILSFAFHYLFQVDSSKFNDDMGQKLLRIFCTGGTMVTRRPTTVEFQKAPNVSDPCVIKLSLGNQEATYRETENADFDSIVDKLCKERQESKIYTQELKVKVTAPDVPNIAFTDLPGLITDESNYEVVDTDERGYRTIREMTRGYLGRSDTVPVVVEPAANIGELDTTLISPLLR